jgi:xylulokinase
MPSLPHARAVMKGLSFDNFTRANLMRAMAESVAFSLKWGFEKISGTLGKPAQFRLTGGGANSGAWRQILADVFDTEVVRVKWDEGGAFGAALLALAVHQRIRGCLYLLERSAIIMSIWTLTNRLSRRLPGRRSTENYMKNSANC